MNTDTLRIVFLILCAALAGAAVSVCGLLSFVGLLVPHATRKLVRGGASRRLPTCALLGASLVSICDTVARTLFAPYELSVGILLALLGVPFFLVILLKRREGTSYDRD